MSIQESIAAAINGKALPEIVAVFRNGKEVKFTVSSLPLLKTDNNVSMVYSADTGEIIYTKE